MRIAQIAPLEEAVPPERYGGTERIVAYLTDALVDLGHEVTLFASGESRTRGELVPVIRRALRLARPRPNPPAACAMLLERVAAMSDRFDLIHAHVDWLHLPVLRRLGVPFITTFHGRLDLPGLAEAVEAFPDAGFVSISDHQRRPLPRARWLGTVPHGLPLDLLQPTRQQNGYLAFLGRMSAEKGPDVAIRLARRSGLLLRLAAKVPRREQRYFKSQIDPYIDDARIQFVGEIGEERKAKFLGDAKALLFPIDWPEPFGLVLIEAMACGTPVVAFRRGAVPEIVEDGVTGFVVDDEEQAFAALGRLDALDRARIREIFEQRFTARRMADDYVAVYARVIAEHSR